MKTDGQGDVVRCERLSLYAEIYIETSIMSLMLLNIHAQDQVMMPSITIRVTAAILECPSSPLPVNVETLKRNIFGQLRYIT
jgi:hypothetical protein